MTETQIIDGVSFVQFADEDPFEPTDSDGPLAFFAVDAHERQDIKLDIIAFRNETTPAPDAIRRLVPLDGWGGFEHLQFLEA